jgi:hypothetical protein
MDGAVGAQDNRRVCDSLVSSDLERHQELAGGLEGQDQ